LATLGESPLNAVDPDHPFVPSAQNSLNQALTQEQGKGYWFNTDFLNLMPDPATGYIYVPKDAITVEVQDPAIIQRGRRLYTRVGGSFEFKTPIYARVVREIPFDDLPMLVNQLVAARAVMDFQVTYDGDQVKYGKLQANYNQIYLHVAAENIRQQKANMNDSVSVQAKLAAFRPVSKYTFPYYGGDNNYPGGMRSIGIGG
jgi:hypothetical protein